MMQSSSSGQAHPAPPTRSASSAIQNLLKLIAKITVADIKSAERCGGGGFGDVYVLTHAAIGKLALKRMRTSGNQQEVDEQMRRSTREAETWRKLDHPNILPFLDVLERSDNIYLVSPFVQNGSITDFIRRHPDVNRARLIQEAAAGIAYLHRNGIVHGDIKGANILVSDDIRALLCDFGLARPDQSNTSTGMQGVGTIRWQSPELLLSGAGKSFKSDVWAFGMTIHEVLSGHIPYYQHDSTPAVILAVLVHKQRPPKEPVTSPTGASYASLWEVAGDCWHEEPDQRPDIQEAHNRLILGGFQSLLLSPLPRNDEDTPHEVQMVSSPGPSPSSSPLALSGVRVDSGPSERHTSSLETTFENQERDDPSQISRNMPQEQPTGIPVKSRKLPRDGLLGSLDDSVYGVGFSPDGQIVVTGSADNILQLWDVGDGSARGEPLMGHTDSVYCVAFSPDGTTLVSGSFDYTLQVWDAGAGRHKGGPLKGHSDRVYCLAFSPDGMTVASGSFDNTIRFWDVKAESQIGEPLKGHTNGVYCVVFSPDGRTIASASMDTTFRLWDVESRSQMGRPLGGRIGEIFNLAFSPDGTMIATGSGDHTLRLWEVKSGRQIGKPLEGHTDAVYCVAFSPDGSTIVTGSSDSTLRLWDVEARSQRGEPLKGHDDSIFCVAFSPDGTTIASGSLDRTVRLWDAES